MCRLRFIEPEEVGPSAKAAFQKLVMVPNLLCVMANSEAAMKSFVDYTEHQKEYKLSHKHGKMISLAVSQFNDCDYCIALHTSDALDSGLLTDEECLEARRMNSPHPKDNALLILTREILNNKGHVSDLTMEHARRYGFDDQEMVEIINIIGVITIANYTANLARPELDFLEPPPLED
jgi:uncharacterized peroxidase-related enzyme